MITAEELVSVSLEDSQREIGERSIGLHRRGCCPSDVQQTNSGNGSEEHET